MKYILLIWSYPGWDTAMPQEEVGSDQAEYLRLTGDWMGRGVATSAEYLMPPHTATTVKVQEGKTVTTDGPFVETKELLAGYYVVNAADLDEATALAAQLPGARYGAIEVRPLVDLSTLY